MAEPYSDEELDEGIRPPRVEPHVAFFIGRLGMTIERLQRERDKARRVAKVLAERGRATEEYNAAQRTALAYPEASE